MMGLPAMLARPAPAGLDQTPHPREGQGPDGVARLLPCLSNAWRTR